MGIIQIKQGSDDWKELRLSKITATDIAAITGKSPYKKPLALFRQKMEIDPPEPENAAMRLGTALESDARAKYEELTGRKMPSAVFVNDERPWQLASLDGLSEDGDLVLEIKCGKGALEKAKLGEIPIYYQYQMQWQLSATGATKAHYFCYFPEGDENTFILKVINRDDDLIEELLVKGKEFWDMLQDGYHPDDYVVIDTPESKAPRDAWIKAYYELKVAKATEKSARDALLEHSDDGNCIIHGVKADRVSRENTDYKRACLENNIDLEIYKKPSIGFWKLKAPKD